MTGTIKKYTKNFKMKIPEFNIATWHDAMEYDFTLIDSLLGNFFNTQNFKGDWQAVTEYHADDVVYIDEDGSQYDGMIMKVLVDHTTDDLTFSEFYELHQNYYERLFNIEQVEEYLQQARDWASKTDGKVEVDGIEVDYSSKAYATGGEGTEQNNAKYFKNLAQTAATNADSSASAASTSATNAHNSEVAAEISRSNARSAAETAISARIDAIQAKNDAQTAQTAAETAQTAAETAATSAQSSATSASTAATTATNQANIATTQATNAASSASSASSSADSAQNSATSAATSESNANTSATNAQTSANNASTSATNAATSATNADTFKQHAQIWAEGTDEQVQALGGTHSAKGWTDYIAQYVRKTIISITGDSGTFTDTQMECILDDTRHYLLQNDGQIFYLCNNLSTLTYKTYINFDINAEDKLTAQAIYVQIDEIAVNYKHWSKETITMQGGGSEEDNLSITKNTNNRIQTVGVIDQNDTSTALKQWSGTLAEYNAIATKDPDTIYNITDDNTAEAFDAYSKAETDLLFAKDSNVVHKTGNETISGKKVFSNRVIQQNSVLDNNFSGFQIYDNTHNIDGGVALYLTSNGKVYSRLLNHSYNKNCFIDCVIDSNGTRDIQLTQADNLYGITPSTSDNSTKIATTAYVQSNLSGMDYVIEYKHPTSSDPTWYRKYKSGWIEQGGSNEAGGQRGTQTLAVTMLDTNYTVTVTGYSTGDSYNTTMYYGNKTKTSFDTHGYQCTGWSWSVCGRYK